MFIRRMKILETPHKYSVFAMGLDNVGRSFGGNDTYFGQICKIW